MILNNPYRKGGMFEGASPLLFERAKQLRKNMTDAETVLWLYLKEGIRKMKFRRQHPVGFYIVDFYCHKVKMVIEVDGSIHNKIETKEHDKIKQQQLEEWGYHVLRFTNQQIIKNTEKVIATITKVLLNLFNNKTQNASSD